MSFEEFTEWLRLANTALALVALVGFLLRFNYMAELIGRDNRLVCWAIVGLLGGIAYDHAESYYLMTPIGLRSYFLNAFLTLLLVGLWRTRGK